MTIAEAKTLIGAHQKVAHEDLERCIERAVRTGQGADIARLRIARRRLDDLAELETIACRVIGAGEKTP